MIINQTGGGSGDLPLNIIAVKKPMPGVAAYEKTDEICSGTPSTVIFPSVKDDHNSVEAFNYGPNRYISTAPGAFVFTHFDISTNTMVVDKTIKYKKTSTPYCNNVFSYIGGILLYLEGSYVEAYNDSGFLKRIDTKNYRVTSMFYNGSDYTVKYVSGSANYIGIWKLDIEAGTLTDAGKVTYEYLYSGELYGAFGDTCFVRNDRASPYITVEKWVIENGKWVKYRSYPKSQKSNATNIFSSGMRYQREGVGALRGVYCGSSGQSLPNIIMGPDMPFPESTKSPTVRIWIGDAYADKQGLFFYNENGEEFSLPYKVSTQVWEVTPKVMVYSPDPSKVDGGLRVGDELIIF